MAVEIYLGNPPEHIVQWIKDHSGPAPRAVTRIWWSNDESDYSDCPSNNGTFDSDCFPEGKYSGDAVKAEFGSDVISIADEIFYNNINLTSVTISDSVTSIGYYAFSDCEGLTSVMIGNGVTSIGEDAFYGCSSLTSVTFLGKTFAQVEAMDNHFWGIEDTSIIHVA